MRRLFLFFIMIALVGSFPEDAQGQDSPSIATEQAVTERVPVPEALNRDVLKRIASKGTLLMVEDFEYTTGSNLNGLGGWNAHSGAGTNAPQITAGGLSYPGYAGSDVGNAVSFTTTGEDNNKPFASYPDGISSGSLYYALLVRLDSVASNGDYFFHLNKAATTFTARIFARRAANGNIRFGIGKSSTAANINYSDSIYNVGATYLLAVKYTVIAGTANDTVALWVNPAVGGSEPEATVLQSAADRVTADLDTVYGVALRQGTASNAAIGTVDGIRVGTSWEDVVVGSGGGLTGTKTIGGTSPNYPTITAALADLQLQGVGTGGVTFRIRPGVYGTDPGVEVDSVLGLGSIPGSSSSNPVRFVGEGSVIIERTGTAATNDLLLFVSGADYTEWDSLTFRQRPGGSAVELGIAIQNASATDGSKNNTFKNFTVTLNTAANTNFGGGIAVFMSAAFPPSSQAGSNDYNKFYNFAISGSGHGFQVVGNANAPDLGTEIGTVDGGSSTLSYGHNSLFNAAVGFGTQEGIKVFDIDIVSGTQAGAVSLYGIAAPFAGQGSSTAEIYSNRIRGMAHASTTTGNNRAIAVINLGTYDIYSNTIFDISHATTSSGFVSGISIEGGPPVSRIYNNFVSDIKAPTGTGTTLPTIRAMNAASGDLGIYYNSVYLDAPNSAVSRSSAAIYVTATPTSVDYRNNIFINKSGQGSGTTGRQAAFTKSSTSLVNLAPASNNNLLYAGLVAGSTNKRAIFYPASGTGDTTLAQYKARLSPLETAAVTEDVSFVNTTTPPYDLHISSAVPTRLESGGNNVTGITTDIDGDVRVVAALINSDVAPDIGADEFSGTPIDEVAPTIEYTPLASTTSTGDRTLLATIKDLVSGVHVGPGFTPRLYYKKDGGSNWTSPHVDSAGIRVGNDWTFTISAANLGGLAIGDSIYYYVAAADSTENVATNPAGGSGVPPGSTPPAATNIYTVRSDISGTMTIGASGATFTNVKAAFDSINTSVVSGTVTLLINSDYAGDGSFPIALNEVTYGAGGPFTITLRPNTGATPTISGSSSTSIIRLGGADNVIIDGSNSGSARGASRDLTIENTATSTNTAAIWISSLGAGAGATNITIRNCNIYAGSNTVTSSFGIHAGGATISTTGTGADNHDLIIENNSIARAYYAIFARGTATGRAQNLMISSNSIGSDSASRYVTFRGVDVQNAIAPTISQNSIFNMIWSATGTSIAAIDLGTNVTGALVSKNNISVIEQNNTSGWSAYGINISSGTGTSGIEIVNNFISGVKTYGWNNSSTTFNPFGIRITGGTNHKVYYNSVNMFGSFSTTGAGDISSNLIVTSSTATGLDVRNNVFSNSMTGGGTPKCYSIYGVTGVTFGTINHNDYFPRGSHGVLGFLGADVTTLADWRTATTQDANSISADPLFVSPTNLHIQTGIAGPVDSAGIPIAGITDDIDGEARHATFPDIGADEFTLTIVAPPSITSVTRSVRVPSAGDPVTVTGAINDALGVTSVNLLYQINGGTTQTVAMTLIGGTPQDGTWEGVLPGSANANGNRIEYRVQALNSGGATATTNVVPANSYYAGISPLSLTGLRRMHPDGRIMDSTYYARITGTVNGPNYQTTNLGYHLQDAVGGIQLFSFGILIPPLNLGDSIIVTGRLAQFRGLTEIIPDTQSVDVQVVATGRPVTITEVSIQDFFLNPELYESRALRILNLQRRHATPPWPSAGQSVNIIMYQNVLADTIIMRIDSDTEIDGSPEPTYPVNVTGVITQFSSAASLHNDGYQTQPRYLTDFVSAGGGLAGNYTVGAGGAFPTLDSAFSALMSQGVAGAVTLSLIDSLYRPSRELIDVDASSSIRFATELSLHVHDELGTQSSNHISGGSQTNTGNVVTINIGPIPGAGPSNRITVRPADGVRARIVGTGASTFNLMNAGYITFDGISTVGATQLAIENTATNGFAVAMLGNSDHNIIRNVSLRVPYASGIGVLADTASGAAPDSNLIESNLFPIGRIGVYLRGGNFIANANRIIGNTFGGDSLGAIGVYNQQVAGSVIANNLIQNVIDATTTGNNVTGIWIATKQLNVRVYGNVISGVRNRPGATGTGFTNGIYYFGALGDTTRSLFYNNMIYGLDNRSTNASATARGITSLQSIRDTLVYNTVYLVGTDGGSSITAAMSPSTSAFLCDWRNNIAINARVAMGTGRAIALYAGSTTATFTSNYNDLHVPTQSGSHVAAVTTTNYTTLADWQATGRDLNSVSVMPAFQAPHLHINPAVPTPIDGGATPIAGIATDIDGQVRNATTPDIGADEFTSIPPAEALADHITSAYRASVTNEGNIGYLNAFPPAGPGRGFQFNPISATGQRLFEGSIMIGLDSVRVSDAARNNQSPEQLDADFQFLANLDSSQSSGFTRIIRTAYSDALAETPFGVRVDQRSVSWDSAGINSFLIMELDLQNTTGNPFSGLVVGGYFDWDVNPSTAQDRGQVIVDSTNTIPGVNNGNPFPFEMMELHQGVSPTAWMGVVPLNENRFLGRRIAIQSSEIFPPHMTNGDKWRYMTTNRATNPNGDAGANVDHGQVFGLGPYNINAGATRRVGFALVAGNSLQAVVNAARAAQRAWVQRLGNSINVVTGFDGEIAGIPETYVLSQNYPNPFNPATIIRYGLPVQSSVSLKIYNILGQEVVTLADDVKTAGYYDVHWNGRNQYGSPVASGVYFYRIEARAADGSNVFTNMKKMLLVK